MNSEETQYVNLIRRILDTGHESVGRGGAVTKSIFGATLEFSLENNTIPLFTTKRVFFRGVVEELLWILRGETDVNKLKDKDIHIWDGHSSEEFLHQRGLVNYREGDIGPLYGFQLRHFGAEYVNCDTDYKDQGVDQLFHLLYDLENDPRSRRHVVSLWNPADLNKMALTPCHAFFQMYIDDNGLSCLMYQRSADIGLGVPFNVASYSILTKIIAEYIGVKPYKFIHQMGDVHIYKEHYESIQEHFSRDPLPFPKLFINKNLNSIEDIENLSYDDFKLKDYKHHGSIKMNLVI